MKEERMELFRLYDENKLKGRAGSRAKYKRKLFTLYAELYASTDAELIEYCKSCIDAGETKAGLVKRLIREEIKRREEE